MRFKASRVVTVLLELTSITETCDAGHLDDGDHVRRPVRRVRVQRARPRRERWKKQNRIRILNFQRKSTLPQT